MLQNEKCPNQSMEKKKLTPLKKDKQDKQTEMSIFSTSGRENLLGRKLMLRR
jgi:hypothetical protein